MESKDLKESFYRYLRYFHAKDDTTATSYDKFMALAYAVRSEMVDDWIRTQKNYREKDVRRVYYLSMEYVFGKNLRQNMQNLGIEAPITSAVRSLGFSIEELFKQEDDFELGNAGKGRLSVCFLESLATLGVPAMAYGLRYDYAQFQQDIKNGIQIERPYDYLHRGHPWEIIRPEYSCTIQFAGDCKPIKPEIALGRYNWKGAEHIHAVPYDVPIPGYQNHVVNTLRLWSARASEEFLPDYANHGDYVRACEEKSQLSRITKVLFPEEDVRRATELRMKQQYFFVSAALQDIIRRYKTQYNSLLELDKKICIQLNGSRCALAIPEMMRLLVDVEGVGWDKALEMTRNIFAYTSHAVTKDNLETWPVYKVGQILPRHMQIIFDMNQNCLENLRSRYNPDPEAIREFSVIEEGEVKRIRLANLAVLGSFSVNGVSREQTEIVKKKIFPVYSRYYPEKFSNKTIGVDHRRWVLCANRDLSDLITKAIGKKWIIRPVELMQLERLADDRGFLDDLLEVKRKAKIHLGSMLKDFVGSPIDESMMFDIQSSKIHPYKRQVLNILNILNRYQKIKQGRQLKAPRLHIFAGKASPSDFLAKQIIHLINVTADLINKDPVVNEQMKVVFIPNFGMTWAEALIPAADLSEQIATASMESSGTFNIKYAFNGALTLASRSGSNLEMAERIGAENYYLFGKNGDELNGIQNYKPWEMVSSDQNLKSIFELIEKHLSSIPDGNSIYPLLSSLKDNDRFHVLTDFNEYIKVQENIGDLYTNSQAWARKSLLNIARVGWFSSDRAAMEYACDVWKIIDL